MAEPPKNRPAGQPTPPPRLERVVPQGATPVAAPGASRGLAAPEVTAAAAVAAGLPHQGSLAAESALHLFALCAATAATGRLAVGAAGRTYLLHFRKGSLEHAAALDPAEALPAWLLGRGVVTAEQVAQAEAARAQAGGDVVAALVTLRLVNPGDIVRLIQEHGAALAGRALALEEGRWRWEPGVPPPPGAVALGSPWTLLGAAVRALDPAAVLRRLGAREQLGASRVVGRVRVEELRLTPQEARAATLLDGQRLADVARAHPAEATTILRVALLLAEVELLAFGPPRAAPAAQPAPRVGPPTGGEGRGEGAAAPQAATRATPPQAAPRPAPVAPRPPSAAPKPAPPPAPAADSKLSKAALEATLAKMTGKESDLFQVLGVKRDTAAAQIKIAYFQLAKTYHPDALPQGSPADVRKLCADVFSSVGEAWAVLGDDAQRAQYLDDLKTGAGVDVDVMNILQAENVFQNGTLLVKARRYDEALPRFEEAMKLNPDEPEFGMWKAWCEFLLATEKKKQHPAAAAAIEAGLKKNARCAQGYLFLGQMAKIVGDLAGAEKHLKRGLDVAPEHADLQRELKYLRK
ncbi:MAG TPA: DnaJ domain-containing protein [Anaeromyxobacteraceae bacterium]|nr:DnaJ domain-containing protein [Anaeromyxobacteraceae bacterium]